MLKTAHTLLTVVISTALLLSTIALLFGTIGTIGTTGPTPTVPDVPFVRVEPSDPVITVETPHGIATISGPAAEYVLECAFPVIVE